LGNYTVFPGSSEENGENIWMVHVHADTQTQYLLNTREEQIGTAAFCSELFLVQSVPYRENNILVLERPEIPFCKENKTNLSLAYRGEEV
jgi:hypothetical protein